MPMKRILVLNGNDLERKITGQILSSQLDTSVQITLFATAELVLQNLRESPADLLVADIQRFGITQCNMITMARQLAPSMSILITSSGNQKEVASAVWRLGVNDYLLKPYRPEWLISAAKVLMHQNTAEGEIAKRQKEFLDRLVEALHRFQYKKCIFAAKEYLDLLYENTNNITVLHTSLITFVKGVAEAGAPFGAYVQEKLSSCVEAFTARLERQDRKYDVYLMLEKMLNIIFDTIEQENLCGSDSEQRVLNYIDRNVRRGLSLNMVADYVNMSACYFSKLFKKMTGKNYIAYVTEGKIDLAKQMLVDTDMSLPDIADELLYNETNYFGKAFKKKTGLTPSEYREVYRKPQIR